MIRVGTSGWVYDGWRGRFYPEELPRARWLHWYAERFPTVEINGTFYRLPKRATVEEWAAAVPAGFRFAAKMSRYLSHVRRLDDDGAVAAFAEAVAPLDGLLEVILLQLPPRFEPVPHKLDAVLGRLADRRVAVEFRDRRWFDDPKVRDILERHGAAMVWSDYPGAESPRWVTADFVYVRCHGTAGRFAGRYDERRLHRLADTLGAVDGDAYCYFNNDIGAAAPQDAAALSALLRARGVPLPDGYR
ncbi:MAG TPA: DUF72 domain-containing protein [Actinobacteria bacterium]|nr:DUF72 domain-containing protein [Actinomycetota bacterium]